VRGEKGEGGGLRRRLSSDGPSSPFEQYSLTAIVCVCARARMCVRACVYARAIRTLCRRGLDVRGCGCAAAHGQDCGPRWPSTAASTPTTATGTTMANLGTQTRAAQSCPRLAGARSLSAARLLLPHHPHLHRAPIRSLDRQRGRLLRSCFSLSVSLSLSPLRPRLPRLLMSRPPRGFGVEAEFRRLAGPCPCSCRPPEAESVFGHVLRRSESDSGRRMATPTPRPRLPRARRLHRRAARTRQQRRLLHLLSSLSTLIVTAAAAAGASTTRANRRRRG
jgi:hypothetical protein